MNKECEIVQDLLPLFIDDVCSESSREYVNKHIRDCKDCQTVLQCMKKDEIAKELIEEKTDIIGRQAKVYKRKSFIAGAIIAGIFMIPILICFIVNLASGAGLSWFFIVLCSLMLAASLIIVPLMTPKNKMLWTLGTGSASLLLLLGVCCVYNGGHWFLVAASSILFGLAMGFMPYVVRCRAFSPHLGNQKSLLCMGVDSVLFWVMMSCIGVQVSNPSDYWLTVFAVAGPLFIYAWGLFALLRYPRCRYLARVGMCIMLTGVLILTINDIVGLFLNTDVDWLSFSIRWNYLTIEGSMKWLFFICNMVVGGILTLVGLIKSKKNENKTL